MAGPEHASTRFHWYIGDLTRFAGDAIVNAANSSLMGGGGVDGAIHRAGGPSIVEECRAIVNRQGPCPPGAAVLTGAGRLPCRWVVHTVGPIYGSDPDPEKLLADAYTSSLALAADAGATTIAFPNISTGVYRFPKDHAARIAIDATARWTAVDTGRIASVSFVCFDEENAALYQSYLGYPSEPDLT